MSLLQTKPKSTNEWVDWNTDPSSDNLSKLMTRLNPTISSALMSYGDGDSGLNTRARILTVDAIKSYDPDKGASLDTHVHNYLQRLRRYRADRSYIVHIPENIRFDAMKIRGYIDVHKEKNNGREPSYAQIGDDLGMSKKRVLKAINPYSEVPENMFIGEKGDITATLARDPQQVWVDYVYHDLDETNKKIFEWTTGYGGTSRLKKKDIAAKLRITPAAVSSRISTIMRQLDAYEK